MSSYHILAEAFLIGVILFCIAETLWQFWKNRARIVAALRGYKL
jgi:hypothetical protein